MFKFIFIFLLFLSKFSYGDNLKNKFVICNTDYVDHIRIVAISFVSEQKAIEFTKHTNDEFMEVYDRWYHTTPTTIHVHYYNNGEIEHSHKYYREINRQTLQMDMHLYDSNDKYTKVVKGLSFESNECKVFLGDPENFRDMISEIVEKN